MTRRSPEQVHEEDGHASPVASCSLCHPEPVGEHELVGEHGPELAVKAVGGVVSGAPVVLNENGPPPLVVPERRPRAGRCRNGCAAPGSHRDGLCHDCHNTPGRKR